MLKFLKAIFGMTQTMFGRARGGPEEGSMIMRTKSLLLMTACVVTAGAATVLATPGRALANNECGSPNFASNPQTVTCTGAFNPYPSGVTYDENTYAPANQGNLQVDIAATAVVNTAGTAVTATGVSGKNAAVVLLNGSSVTGGTIGVFADTTGGGTASITNNGAVTGGTYGLLAQSGGGGLGTVTNNGSVTVTGANAQFGIFAVDGATISNTGSTTINGVGGSHDIAGLATITTTAADAATITNTSTGTVSVTNSTHNAAGFGSGGTNHGSANYTNNGGLTVATTTGAAYGFEVVGGTNVSITDAQTAAGTTTTSITGSGALTGVSVSGVTGTASASISGQNLTLNTSGGTATGVSLSGGSSDTITVAPATFGGTTSFANMSITAANGATGLNIDSGTGANVVTVTGATLGVASSGGTATGVSVTGGAGSSVAVAKGAAGANETVGGVSGFGVIATSTGVNAVTFTGASLTVIGTTGAAVGIQAFGGTDATVTMAPTGGAAALSVSTGGAFVEGAYINGTGVLTGAFGDTVTVSDTNGGVTGVFMNQGASQTLTLSQGLTATATNGYSRGAYLAGSGATTMTVHASGTITASGTGGGDVEGVYAANGGAFTLNGGGGAAPAITVSGGGFAFGVYRNGGAGDINVTTGAITASSTSAASSVGGMALFTTNGSVNATDAGIIDVTSAGGNYGVFASVAGASGGVNLNLNTVRLHGSNSSGEGFGVLVENSTSGSDATTITAQQISTTGQSAVGIVGNTTPGGVGTVTLGSVVAGVHSGGVSTTGAASAAVNFASQDGLLTITNNGLVSTLGANSLGIRGASGAGGVTINNWQVTTAGSGSQGVLVETGSGPAVVTSNSVVTTGANSGAIVELTGGGTASVTSTLASTTGANSGAILTNTGAGATTITSTTATTGGVNSAAIVANSTTGPITIGATNTTATGGTSDAISATASSTGAVIVNLADGGATRSTGGNGVLISTGGAATINVGSAASTATLSGGAWGVNSTASSGTTLNIHGSVTGGLGAAIRLSGGSDHVNNFGTINGFVNIVSTSDVFTNTGTWNAFGSNSTFDPPGVNVLNNGGVININPNGATAATYTFLAPGIPLTINNSGTINLQQGPGGTPHTGDALDIGNAIYAGSGGAQLLIDANLGAAAVGASGAQTADVLLVQTGSVAGSTSIGVRDLGAALPGRFNFTGIQVVAAGSSSAGAFSLAGGSINKGYVQYRLTQSGSNYFLVGLPSEGAFEIVRTGFEAQSYWRRSGDGWSDQMREEGFHETQGATVWAQATTASDTQKSNPTYQVVAINTFTFTPDLDIDNQWTGAQFGVDYGMGHWGYGLTAGFGQQLGHFKADGAHIDLNGANVGVYGRWENDGLFFDGLAKLDSYTVKQKNQLPHFEVDFDGTTVGAELQGGYRWTSGSTFVEPALSLSWTESNLNGFNNSQAGAMVNFNHSESLYGNAGLRVGTSLPHGDWTVTPYAGAYFQGEMAGKNKATITAGTNALTFSDPRGGANGRFELGLSGHGKTGLEFSAAVDGTTGGALSGVSGRIGLAYHW